MCEKERRYPQALRQQIREEIVNLKEKGVVVDYTILDSIVVIQQSPIGSEEKV